MKKFNITKSDWDKSVYAVELIESHYDVDLSSRSREQKLAVCRDLLFTIMNKSIGIRYEDCGAFLREFRGVRRDRTSIYHSVQRMPMNLKDFPYLSRVYNAYFKGGNVETSTKPDASPIDDRLLTSIQGIPKDRVNELCEMIELRKKSWEWKSKDEYEIIECQR